MGRVSETAQPHEVSGVRTKRLKRRGHMFIVDVPTFTKVCDLGDADVAAAYLILAAGTGPDNRTSSWSREAINQRTALNWRKADAALTKLEHAGLIQWLTTKSTRKTRIDLPPVEIRKKMPRHVAAVVDKLLSGEQPKTGAAKAAAQEACDLGWLDYGNAGQFSLIADRPLVKAYLPMSLVGDEFGAAGQGGSIIDRVRMARDPKALLLLVELYAAQDLAAHGGVDREHLRKVFKREKRGASGAFQFWKFTQDGATVAWTDLLRHHWRAPTEEEKAQGYNAGHDFFERAKTLEDAGALEWVYWLAEDEAADSVRIYPVGVERHGKMVWDELESLVGSYAMRATCALNEVDAAGVTREWEALAPREFYLLAERLAKQAVVVGVPRLRYRARTSNASRWRQELVEEARERIQMFRGIINEKAPELLVDADRRFADFNV